MAIIRFTRLDAHDPEQVLPMLLKKAEREKQSVLIRCADTAQVKALSKALWSYKPTSFLPHEILGNGNEDTLAPLLTARKEKLPPRDHLITIGCAHESHSALFPRITHVFSANDPEAVRTARHSWKALTDSEHDCEMWFLSHDGQWYQPESKQAA